LHCLAGSGVMFGVGVDTPSGKAVEDLDIVGYRGKVAAIS